MITTSLINFTGLSMVLRT